MALDVCIAGLGKYLPESRISSEELESRWALPAGWIVQRTGVRERRYVSGETASYMAAKASLQALAAAGLKVSDIDCIIGASAAPQQTIPCTAALVQRELGAIDGGSACLDINATCLSFLTALELGALYLAHGLYRHILIFSSEIASVALNSKRPDSACLFGDAAAAVVLQVSTHAESHFLGAKFATYSSGADLTRILGGGTLHHPNDPQTVPQMNLFEMDGTAVFRQASRLIKPFLGRLLTQVGWSVAVVDRVIPHQASKHALGQLYSLGFLKKQVFSNIENRGNCVAASIPLALVEAWESGQLQRGDRVLLLGTAAGLMLGGVGLRF